MSWTLFRYLKNTQCQAFMQLPQLHVVVEGACLDRSENPWTAPSMALVALQGHKVAIQ